MPLVLSETDIAWIAGLLEGEGTFGLDARSVRRSKVSTAPPAPYIKIAMTDEDVIQRFSGLVKKSYFSPKRGTKTGKKVYIVHIGDRETLNSLLPKIYPYLGKRRQPQVQKCLDALTDWKKWYTAGGRSKMAAQGPLARKLEKPTSSSQNDDMVDPDVFEMKFHPTS